MKQVPIVIDFNPEEVIGHLIIDESKIPNNSNWVLAIGTKAERLIEKGKTNRGIKGITGTTYALVCVSVQSDEQYAEYLRSAHFYN